MVSEQENPYASPQTQSQASTEDSQHATHELATRWARFLGSFIDGLIMVPLALLIAFLLAFLLDGTGVAIDRAETTIADTVLSLLVGISIFLAVNGYLLANRGQTVGKVVMKTRIVSDDGEMLPLGPLILKRYLPFWIAASIPAVGGFISLADALLIFRENRKCLHDDIAGTKVIKLS